MSFFEIVHIVYRIIVGALQGFLSVYGVYAVYYAYGKVKDERQKYIVLQSSAYAFYLSFVIFGLRYRSPRR